MSSYQTPEEVVDDLGEKFLDEFLKSVSAARTDYDRLRQWQPGWMTRFSQRFVANFIHERIWASMTERVDSLPDVTVIDKEPRREMTVSSKYIVRFKRHHTGDRISTYPTEGAMAFWAGDSVPFDGLELVSLALGYLWDADEHEIRDTVISYRAGKDNPIWSIRLDAGGSGQPFAWTPVIDPNLPQVDLSLIETTKGGEAK